MAAILYTLNHNVINDLKAVSVLLSRGLLSIPLLPRGTKGYWPFLGPQVFWQKHRLMTFFPFKDWNNEMPICPIALILMDIVHIFTVKKLFKFLSSVPLETFSLV